MARVPRVVVIGAGIGGLTTAALLAKAGLSVTVLEAHIYPGGCAGTFYHQGYQFDAGATVAGGFYPGGPMSILAQTLDLPPWPVTPTDIAMNVHLPAHYASSPDNAGPIQLLGNSDRWAERTRTLGEQSLDFWRWQERTADLFWDLALRLPPWPAQSPAEWARLLRRGAGWAFSHLGQIASPKLLQEAFSPLAPRLQNGGERLRLLVDGQLLIAAQTTAAHANALYAAAALDLPRRGIVHFHGGIGTLAHSLVDAVRAYGGDVHFRNQATRILHENGRPVAVQTKRNQTYDADLVIANLTPWNIRELWGEPLPAPLRDLPSRPTQGWGAFTLYAGVDAAVIDATQPLHHQVIVQEPLGEGNSIFVSISPADDTSRAPANKRAVTISTHTALGPWWRLHKTENHRYAKRRENYTQRILAAVETIIPGFSEAADLLLPGTPVTFNRFTRRAFGWVGGFPQTSLFNARGPYLSKHLWMVGDSIFPGQSTAAVALGGMRVAESILHELGGAPQIVTDISTSPIY